MLTYPTPVFAREGNGAFSSYDISTQGFSHDHAEGRRCYWSGDQFLSISDFDSVSFVTSDKSPLLFRILTCEIRMNISVNLHSIVVKRNKSDS